MKIAQKVKLALDETRMLVLGAQILIGFQFRGVFQDLYSELPAPSRYLNGLALLLMVLALALLILPAPTTALSRTVMRQDAFRR
jgi:Family of unknown function (DUF6328)